MFFFPLEIECLFIPVKKFIAAQLPRGAGNKYGPVAGVLLQSRGDAHDMTGNDVIRTPSARRNQTGVNSGSELHRSGASGNFVVELQSRVYRP